MINDEERREVAARLRELAAHPDIDGDVYCGGLVDCGLLQRGTYRCHTTPESVEHMADLIDRPTCCIHPDVEDEGTIWDLFGTCTCCGAVVDAYSAIATASGFLPTRYCPACGARVVG